MGVKERRTKILLSLFLLSDFSPTDSRKPFSFVLLDEKAQTIFDYSFNQKTKGTISTILKEGLAEKNPADTKSNAYHLTDKGFSALCLEFPAFRFLRDTWDQKLRIISYEIPESKREIRDRLRREMQGWGLGPWHRSFWLTPHPVINNLEDLVGGREEEKFVQAFESTHVFGDREILIEKVWQKVELDKAYRALFKKWHEVLSKEEDKLVKLRMIINEYVGILRTDPGLPHELVSKGWIGHEAFNIYREIKNILFIQA